MLILSINLVNMLQVEPFEKIILNFYDIYIRDIIQGTPYKVIIMPVIVYFYRFSA